MLRHRLSRNALLPFRGMGPIFMTTNELFLVRRTAIGRIFRGFIRMQKLSLLLLFLYLLSVAIFATTPASAAVIQVPGDAATIQGGIDLAVDGNVVLVADGTWLGAGNRDLDFGGRAITVRSLNGPAGCIINCFSLITDYRGFWFHNGEGAGSVLRGFTITSGSAASGGGIRCSGASPTIIDCVITNCTATSYGGGFYGENSSPRLINCRINGCTANTGGGAYFNGGAPLLENCRVDGNAAQGNSLPGLGGGLYSNSSSPTILHTIFENNSAPLFGGGIAAWGSTVPPWRRATACSPATVPAWAGAESTSR